MPLKIGTTDIIRLYCTPSLPVGGVTQPPEEMMEYKIGTTTYHKRVTLTFNANGGSGGSSQTRTWGVENVTQPSNPTRTGYTFLGWATTSGATTPNVTFPFLAPSTNTTYYAVWEQALTQAVAPSISNVYTSSKTVYWTVKNNHPATATIYSEINDSTPDLYTNSLVADGTAQRSHTYPFAAPATYTVYAQAKVSGLTDSTVTSYYKS